MIGGTAKTVPNSTQIDCGTGINPFVDGGPGSPARGFHLNPKHNKTSRMEAAGDSGEVW